MLKVIALITMIIDHIGYFWNITTFRMIGRISFPIYCFLVSRGVNKSKDLKKYSIRMLVLAIISQCVWKYIGVDMLNILFTYFLFIQFIYFNKNKNNIMSAIIFILAIVISPKLDYAMYGFALLFIFYYITDKRIQALVMLGANIYFINSGLLIWYQMFSLLSMIIISIYDKPKHYKKFKKYKEFFYISYPLHLIILFEIFKYL